MLRGFKYLPQYSGKDEEIENVRVNPKDSSSTQSSVEPSRAPLNTIQDPAHTPKPEPDVGLQNKIHRTPSKNKGKGYESTLPYRTPDKAKNRFGWAQNNELSTVSSDTSYHSAQVGRGVTMGNGGFPNVTPRSTRTVGRATPSESNSTQSTPTKSVTKPPNSGVRSKADGNLNARLGNYAALYKGIPSSSGPSTVVNTVEVPHFDLKEDPSFWINHNVQVIIRVRPLNDMERSINGYNRCLKQESAQSITWIGQPETRFTFDHVACETADQEMLFRMAGLPMVENCLSGYNSCIFAYGQTGSGKTYTMLGEIGDLEMKPSSHRGMTPRIFEFLFARIQAEEESRRDENLKYNCKCSFLEIYNEQITDLLDPNCTNLLLREDVKKGVYVENLTEFEVQRVSDIIRLLTQGSANRKVAATNMNRESSRSHSVFTCVIESSWKKDSTTNFRFARLNLVDLAGSERQKTSGAEGERLKEAANINKSLSTLGHVIMILVDVAHGKPRHVPYRDSRLTFLLQDSLGGNSKTIIIANVSPAVCCAAETSNTLKFAQRAKLIQNNAVVNEDSTGDVIALQNQIRLLKEELSTLKRQNVSRSLSFGMASARDIKQSHEDTFEMDQQGGDNLLDCESKGTRVSNRQLKSLKTTLAGALRREQMAETSIKQLEAEIEQLNRLVRQREEDTRSCKMMLRFREDKIRRMESCLAGSVPSDTCLLEENKALSDEIQLLQAKLDRNPEVTRFALENIRLLDQLRRYQEFYEEGEREILLDEVSTMREQLLKFIGSNSTQSNPDYTMQPQKAPCSRREDDSLDLELRNTLDELEQCRHNLNSCLEENAKLTREIDSLHLALSDLKSSPHEPDGSTTAAKDQIKGTFLGAQTIPCKDMGGEHESQTVNDTQEILNLHLELDIIKIILKEERSLRCLMEEKTTCLNRDLQMAKDELLLTFKKLEDTKDELTETKSVVEALESQQILSINEMEEMRNKNSHYLELMRKQELEIMALKNQISSKESRECLRLNHLETDNSPLQRKLKMMHDSLEKAKKLNILHQSNLALQISNEEEMDEVRRQAEGETAEVIVCMQEELALLQHQVLDNHAKEIEMKENIINLEKDLKEAQEKLLIMVDENKKQGAELEEKDQELRSLAGEWEILTSQIEEVLADGCEALIDASDQLDHISNSFPHKRIRISEQVGMMSRKISEKELLIEQLHRCLEDASNKSSEMECMLESLRSAAMLINERHQKECTDRKEEILLLTSQLNEKTSAIKRLEEQVNLAEDHIRKASNTAVVAFIIVNRLSEMNLTYLDDLKRKDILLSELAEANERKDALLIDQSASIVQAERHMRELEESSDKLKRKLSEEEEYSHTLERRLEYIEKSSISKTREQLATLQNGLTSIKSYAASFTKNSESFDNQNELEDFTSSLEDNSEARTGIETQQDDDFDLHCVEEPTINLADHPSMLGKSADDQKHQKSERMCKNVCERDVTITLLKKEIECALKSLKEVQEEMSRLHTEKKKMSMSERKTQQSIKCLTTEILSLQVAISDFEEQSKVQIEALTQKLQDMEATLKETGSHWCQMTEGLEVEVEEAKIIADQKAAEASCILAKFEEAQDAMKEADIMINELMIANETMKLDIKRLQEAEVTLLNEKCILLSKVESLQSTIDLKHQEVENLVESNLIETRDLIGELDAIITDVQSTVKENFISLAYDFQCIKSQLLYPTKLVQSWLEKIWSEIVVKDCAMSVLHLCHMAILLETVTGLHAENSLLSHGLCESNSAISGLKEHNFKTRRELEMCRILEGKLLADIKNSFDRISRKEEETGAITIRLKTFEKKISDLQLQEEMMLQRSNDMGSQLAALMREIDFSNTRALTSLLDQEKVFKEKVDAFESQADSFVADWCSRDFESLILASELENKTCQMADMEKDFIKYFAFLDHLKREIIFFQVEAELAEQILRDKEVEVSLLKGEVQQTEVTRQDLEQNIEILKAVSCSNNALQCELGEIKETNEKLLGKLQALEAEYDEVIGDYIEKDVAFEFYLCQNSILGHQNKELQKLNWMLENSSSRFQHELKLSHAEITRMQNLRDENESLRYKVKNLMTENSFVLQTLDKKICDFKSLSRCLDVFDKENCMLQDFVNYLQTSIGSLQNDLETQITGLSGILDSQSVSFEEISVKCQDLRNHIESANRLKEENVLQNRLQKFESMVLIFKTSKSLDWAEAIEMMVDKSFHALEEEFLKVADNMLQDILENGVWASKFIEQFESLDCLAKELVATNLSLQADLSRKDDVIKGLLYDMSLLQESASNSKDQKDEMEDMVATVEALEDELAVKSSELDSIVANCHMLEAQMQNKSDIIADLELGLSKERESQKFLVSENQEIRAHIEDVLAAKNLAEDELAENRKMTKSLENEMKEMRRVLSQMNDSIGTLGCDLNAVENERDQLQEQVLCLEERLEKAEAQAEENEAIAQEAQQVAESRKTYAEDKEAEVKLLERSVEELECTINVLENKVDIVKGEVERQRLQREELELELDTIKHQLQNVESAYADMKRFLDENERSLREARNHTQVLRGDLDEKDTEIAQLKAHISELNLHAEAQAQEYRQKFKALEAMAEQVKPEVLYVQASSSSSNKSDKNATKSRGSSSPATKPRGSGSPFRCIGLGLAQQIKSEKIEELAAARLRIEELESLAISRQKEIFQLNARLANTESMTHDVIRDLLVVKSDMTSYMSLLDNQQVKKITEKAQFHTLESQEKDQEVIKLKKQLNEFIEEREGWLQEMDRKQAEMVAAQIALEQLRQRFQLLKAENEKLKMDSVSNKNKVMELEEEMKKLSGPQNLQQRIHHHAKIKEENNKLRILNEDLSAKLWKSDKFLARVKEELACLRASVGAKPCVDFDEEQRLAIKVKEIEQEKVELGQQLLGLCTNVLKAAGISKPISDVNPSLAEEAIEQLKNRITSLEMEQEDLMFKNRIINERIRLSELMPQSSPLNSKHEESIRTPPKAVKAPILSSFDR